MKPYVLTPHLNCFIEMVQMRGHNICFMQNKQKLSHIITKYPLLPRTLVQDILLAYHPNRDIRMKDDKFQLHKIDYLGFYILFNNISVISGRWEGDNKRLCAMEPCLQLKHICLGDSV